MCDLCLTYDVGSLPVNGTIQQLGRFEGECRYMPHFYDAYMDGRSADEQPNGVLSVIVDDADKALFPELKRRKRVRFVITGSGFVCEV